MPPRAVPLPPTFEDVTVKPGRDQRIGEPRREQARADAEFRLGDVHEARTAYTDHDLQDRPGAARIASTPLGSSQRQEIEGDCAPQSCGQNNAG